MSVTISPSGVRREDVQVVIHKTRVHCRRQLERPAVEGRTRRCFLSTIQGGMSCRTRMATPPAFLSCYGHCPHHRVQLLPTRMSRGSAFGRACVIKATSTPPRTPLYLTSCKWHAKQTVQSPFHSSSCQRQLR